MQALQQICVHTLVSVSYADADQAPGFSANAAIGFPLDSCQEASQATALNNTMTLLLEHDKQLFWAEVFPTCFSYFQNIVSQEMACYNEPDREDVELLSVEQYVDVISKFRGKLVLTMYHSRFGRTVRPCAMLLLGCR